MHINGSNRIKKWISISAPCMLFSRIVRCSTFNLLNMLKIAKINPNISKIPPAIYFEIPRHLVPEMIELSRKSNNINLELLEQDDVRESDVRLTDEFQRNYPNLSQYFQFNKPLKIYYYGGCWWPNWLFVEKIKAVEEQKPSLSIY